MPGRDINIVVSATDRASGVIKGVGASIRSAFGGVGDAGNGFNSLAPVAKFFAGMSAVGGAINVSTGLIKGFRGDADAMADSLERLPFGIGLTAAALKGLMWELSGTNKLMQEAAEDADRLAQRSGRILGSVVATKGAREETVQVGFRTQMANAATDNERAEIQRGIAIHNGLREMQDLEAKGVPRNVLGPLARSLMEAADAEFAKATRAKERTPGRGFWDGSSEAIQSRTLIGAPASMRPHEDRDRREQHAERTANNTAKSAKSESEMVSLLRQILIRLPAQDLKPANLRY